eukprot:TRINITY_DN2390_c0_g1_i1.p2 TRINITY_DN2390_c0_g1~~TRINITY_DN2390_c0_g1_i1.p2  ORF type:complete len:52 (-),score=6.04 TRINITY_DN2390_c0_g1_i1:137-292(-)
MYCGGAVIIGVFLKTRLCQMLDRWLPKQKIQLGGSGVGQLEIGTDGRGGCI